MNTTKQLQQVKLNQWAARFKDQSQSGLTVKQWCDQNGYTVYTYNYWKRRLKENYVESVLPEIVPITSQVPTVLRDSRELSIVNTISISLENATISLNDSLSDEMLCRIVTALRHA